MFILSKRSTAQTEEFSGQMPHGLTAETVFQRTFSLYYRLRLSHQYISDDKNLYRICTNRILQLRHEKRSTITVLLSTEQVFKLAREEQFTSQGAFAFLMQRKDLWASSGVLNFQDWSVSLCGPKCVYVRVSCILQRSSFNSHTAYS